MQHFQRSLVMRLCCATSLATSARASTTLTSDSQVILQTGLDHVGRRTVTLSDGQQLVVEQVTRRGTTVITVSLPEVYIILCENIEQFLVSEIIIIKLCFADIVRWEIHYSLIYMRRCGFSRYIRGYVT